MKRNFPKGFLLLVIIWAAISYGGLVRPIFLPSPLTVFSRLFDLLISGSIFPDIGSTLWRLLLGFLIGVILGVPFGILMGYSKLIYNTFEGLVDFFRSVPVTSLFPLFLLLFGIGDLSKIAMAAWSSSLLILINTMYGVHHASHLRRTVAVVMKASPLQMFRYVVFPDALPNIFIGFRTGISLALIVVVVAEMFMGTKSGLGQVIYNSSLLYDTPQMYAAIFLTGIIGYGTNKLVIFFESRIIHWVGK